MYRISVMPCRSGASVRRQKPSGSMLKSQRIQSRFVSRMKPSMRSVIHRRAAGICRAKSWLHSLSAFMTHSGCSFSICVPKWTRSGSNHSRYSSPAACAASPTGFRPRGYLAGSSSQVPVPSGKPPGYHCWGSMSDQKTSKPRSARTGMTRT